MAPCSASDEEGADEPRGPSAAPAVASADLAGSTEGGSRGSRSAGGAAKGGTRGGVPSVISSPVASPRSATSASSDSSSSSEDPRSDSESEDEEEEEEEDRNDWQRKEFQQIEPSRTVVSGASSADTGDLSAGSTTGDGGGANLDSGELAEPLRLLGPQPPPEVVLPEAVVKAGWLLKRNGGRRPRTLANCSVGSWLQALFWQRRYFRIGREELAYQLREAQEQRGSFGLEDVDQVAVAGSKILVHFAKTQRTGARQRERTDLCLVAPSPQEAELWAEALRSAVAGLRTGLPTHWDVREMLRGEMASVGTAGDAVRLVAKKEMPEGAVVAMQLLMDHAFICKKTQDRRGTAMPLRMQVVQVFGVQNIAAWTDYAKARVEVCGRATPAPPLEEAGQPSDPAAQPEDGGPAADGQPAPGKGEQRRDDGIGGDEIRQLTPQVRTATVEDPKVTELLGELDESANEHWLFHGSTPEAVQSITDSEFRINLAGSHRGTLYGKGVYLAECCSKADEYAEEGEDGLCGMLVCRAALGRVLVDSVKRPDVGGLVQKCTSGEYDSVCGDRWTASGTFREFIFYNGKQVYPAYMVFYRRSSLHQLLGHLRQAAGPSGDPDQALRLALYAARVAVDHPNDMVRASIKTTIRAQATTVADSAVERLKSEKESERRRNAFLLGMLGQDKAEVIAGLSRCLKDGESTVRRAACSALGQLGLAALSAVAMLEELLCDESPEVCATAAWALGELAAAAGGSSGQPQSAAQALLRSARASLFGEDAEQARGPLAGRPVPAQPDADAGVGGPEGRSTLLTSCTLAPKEEVRSTGASGGDGRAERIAGGGRDLRCARAHLVASLGRLERRPQEVLPLLGRALGHECGDTRAAAATALSQLRVAALPLADGLVRALGDSRVDVRKAAVEALGNLGQRVPQAVPGLAKRLGDPNEEVCRAAATALAGFGKMASGAVPSLSAALHRENAQLRKAVLAALGDLGTVAKNAMPAVCFMLQDPRTDVVEAAQVALQKMGGDRRNLSSIPPVMLKGGASALRSASTSSLGSRSKRKDDPFGLGGLADGDAHHHHHHRHHHHHHQHHHRGGHPREHREKKEKKSGKEGDARKEKKEKKHNKSKKEKSGRRRERDGAAAAAATAAADLGATDGTDDARFARNVSSSSQGQSEKRRLSFIPGELEIGRSPSSRSGSATGTPRNLEAERLRAKERVLGPPAARVVGPLLTVLSL